MDKDDFIKILRECVEDGSIGFEIKDNKEDRNTFHVNLITQSFGELVARTHLCNFVVNKNELV